MSRYIVRVAASTVMLLFGFGCEQEQGDVVPLPPVATAKPQPAAEPNIQQAAVAEPSPAQLAESNAAQLQAAQASRTSADELCRSCTEFLSKYVDQKGMVDYRTLLRRKLELATILDRFRTLDPNEYNLWSKGDKIAFWINGYNLEFIKIVLDNYPIESTRVLRLFWPPNSIMHVKGIWDGHKFIIMDEEFTLKDVDERFFQKEFDEPRVFFAIFYASVSGPPLRNEAYCGQNLSAQLDDQVKKFMASAHAFKISRENQAVYLSSILQPTWYGRQFVAKYGTDRKFKQQEPAARAVLNFLTNYLSPQDIAFLETGNYTVQYMRYDWTLNDRSG
jgi:hypothetical protein